MFPEYSTECTNVKCYFDLLPDIILLRIFRRLSTIDSVYMSSLVCTRWNKMIRKYRDALFKQHSPFMKIYYKYDELKYQTIYQTIADKTYKRTIHPQLLTITSRIFKYERIRLFFYSLPTTNEKVDEQGYYRIQAKEVKVVIRHPDEKRLDQFLRILSQLNGNRFVQKIGIYLYKCKALFDAVCLFQDKEANNSKVTCIQTEYNDAIMADYEPVSLLEFYIF